MKKFCLLLGLSAVLLSAAPPKDTVATVATDNYITAAEVQARINTLSPKYAEYYASPDGRRQILDQLIEEKLLTIEAQAQGYAENAEVLKTLNSIKAEVMFRHYVQDRIGDLTVSDSEIDSFYNANKEKLGAQKLADIKQDIYNELLFQKQQERLDALLEAAKAKYPVKTNLTNLK